LLLSGRGNARLSAVAVLGNGRVTLLDGRGGPFVVWAVDGVAVLDAAGPAHA